MKINLFPGKKSRYFPVTIGKESFEVEITQPMLAQKHRDHELLHLDNGEPGEWITHRIESSVTNWRGLETEEANNVPSEEIPFSRENLAVVCESYPEVYRQIVTLAHQAFRGMPEDTEKN